MEVTKRGQGVKRRASFEQADATQSKVSKIHPFFLQCRGDSVSNKFKWLEPLGETHSCLHGINLQPASTPLVAAFDLDGTLIKSQLGNSTAGDWQWWRSAVPGKLKEVHEAGYAIVIFSNQAISSMALKKWKQRIQSISAALPAIPFRLFAATARDSYRKPMPGMWYELERLFCADGITIDRAASFFVGDAAGRQFTKNKGDFASTDRKWALNVGTKFYTPEEYFLGLPTHQNIVLPGFHVSSLPDCTTFATERALIIDGFTKVPHYTPTSRPLVPPDFEQEIVLFVGYPCLGKTTFFRRFFEPNGYVHVNQDSLKRRNKCIQVVRDVLRNHQSCVVDNTNRDAATRRTYVDLAREAHVPIRCLAFVGSMELAWHNNLYRAFNLPPSVAAKEPARKLLPYLAFTSFHEKYEEPREDEGYSEIKKINWVFHGSEEERHRWSMWLQIDGK